MKPDWQVCIQQAYRDFLKGRALTPRLGQKQMIADLARCFSAIEEDHEGRRTSQQQVIVIEAGTGTGKTLAYLLACLPLSQARNKRLVISTATIALQEQLLLRDLPDIEKHTDLSFRYGLAKGRGRYLCTAQLARQCQQSDVTPGQTQDLFDAVLGPSDHDADNPWFARLADQYASGDWDGDRDSLDEAVPHNVWRRLTTDHQRCTNRRCSHFAQACPFFNARRALEQADVIVANHDLVLSDLALGGGVILPAPEQTYYVFDEAHHLADKAIGHFAASFRFNASLKWIRLFKKNLPDLRDSLAQNRTAQALLNQVVEPMEGLERDLGVLYGQLAQLEGWVSGYQANQASHRWPKGEVPQSIRDFSAHLTTYLASLCRCFEKLAELLKAAQEPDDVSQIPSELAAEWHPLIALLHARALAAHELWALWAAADSPQQPPKARWLLRHQQGAGEEEIEVCASPVTAANDLAARLWKRCFGAALTSATLTALGRFDHLRQRTGLPKETQCQVYPSPFDYPRLGYLDVPAQACDPSDTDAHTDALIDFIETELDHPQAAALVLFSSRRQMQAVYEGLSSRMRQATLMQDELPKSRLVEKHRARVDASKPSILFGLASLAEGIDLPGDYLTHVVLARLPFATPDDPVGATLAEWIEAQGGNPFLQLTVPEASVRLVQACGRLIRTETDKGRISLLDKRILTRRYGRQLLDSLPPFQRKLSP